MLNISIKPKKCSDFWNFWTKQFQNTWMFFHYRERIQDKLGVTEINKNTAFRKKYHRWIEWKNKRPTIRNNNNIRTYESENDKQISWLYTKFVNQLKTTFDRLIIQEADPKRKQQYDIETIVKVIKRALHMWTVLFLWNNNNNCFRVSKERVRGRKWEGAHDITNIIFTIFTNTYKHTQIKSDRSHMYTVSNAQWMTK